MLHAKTADADGCWSRIGSSNSNLASWTSNRELDVTIQDPGFAGRMMAMFEEDLENATEIVLKAGKVRRPAPSRPHRGIRKQERYAGRSRLLAGTAGVGATVGAALTRHRPLGSAESAVLAAGGIFVILLALVGLLAPRFLAYPAAIAGLWIGGSLVTRAWRTRRRG